MTEIIELSTDRLMLRQWQDGDKGRFAEINADPDVMEYYPAPLSKSESDAMADKLKGLIMARGWGFWAIEVTSTQEFIGFVGLHIPTYELPVKNCVEIGWRLAKESWGKGYATEAANESLKFAFEKLRLNEVYSFTSVINKRSWAVMERIGMHNTNLNFNHPIVPKDSILSEHYLYKIDRESWLEKMCNN